MSRLSWLQKIYWKHFAKPVAERALFRQLIEKSIGSVLEVGIGDGQRMRRIAKLWRQSSDRQCLRYIGTDEFEAAIEVGRHLRLKQAHQIATALKLKATLIPGDVESAIPRVVHKMGTADLIVADGHLDPQHPSEGILGSWLQHLTHDATIVLACSRPGDELQLVDWRKSDHDARRAA